MRTFGYGVNSCVIESYVSHPSYRLGDFVLSYVSKKDLKRYGIDMSVKDFKECVRQSPKYKVIRTGSTNYQMKHTKVYNFYDFIDNKEI